MKISDPIDEAILRELLQDARLPITTLARRVGRSRTAVQARLDRLERDGVILGYTLRLGSAEPEDTLAAIVAVDIRARNRAAPFLRSIRRIPEVSACYSVTGDHHFMLLVRASTQRKLGDILEAVYSIPDVTRTLTTHILAADFIAQTQ